MAINMRPSLFHTVQNNFFLLVRLDLFSLHHPYTIHGVSMEYLWIGHVQKRPIKYRILKAEHRISKWVYCPYFLKLKWTARSLARSKHSEDGKYL